MLTLRQRKTLTVAGCAALVVAVLIGASFFVPIYGDICSKNEHTSGEECSRHQITLIAFIHIGKALDAAGVAITAIFTGFIAWFTWTLRRSTDKLWEAGEKQFALSSDTAQRQLRAYPGITGAGIIIDTGKISVAFEVKNLSTTPAYRFRYSLEYQFFQPDPIVGFKELAFPIQRWDMAPHSTTTMRVGGKVSESQRASLVSGAIVLVVWGRADYDDAFGCPRYIRFVYRSTAFRDEVASTHFPGGGLMQRTIHICPEPEPVDYEST